MSKPKIGNARFLIMNEIVEIPYETMRNKLLIFESKHPFRVEANVWEAKSDKPYDYYITFIVKQENKTYVISEEGKTERTIEYIIPDWVKDELEILLRSEVKGDDNG